MINDTFLVSVLSGGIAGGIEMISIWPMEYTKTQLQLQEQLKNNNSNVKFNGLYGCLKWTIKNNGILGLYRGLSPMLATAIPKAGIRFGTFTYFQNMFKEKGNVTTKQNFLAGMLSGLTEAIFVVTPVETVKTKLTSATTNFD